MEYAVAGANGLVGSALMRKLTKSDYKVHPLTRKEIDFESEIETEILLKRLSPKVLIDAAARVGGIEINDTRPVDFINANLSIQSNLMKAAHISGVEKFVFLLSSCVYPKFAPQPIKETDLMTGWLEPTNSAYAMAKLVGYEQVRSYRKQYGYNWISVMPTSIYGLNDNFRNSEAHVIPSLIRRFSESVIQESRTIQIWGDGSQKRDFLYSDDLAEAILDLVQVYNEPEIINIGSGCEISIKELAFMLKEISGFQGQIIWDSDKPSGTPRKILDNTKLSERISWKPRIDLYDGLRNTYTWFHENPNAEGVRK